MWFVLAVLVASAPLVLSFWCRGLLPLIDYPQHLAIVTALASCDPQQATGLSRFLSTDLHIGPYATFYVPAMLLARMGLGADVACRLLLTLSIVGAPLAAGALLRAFKRPPWPALFALALGYSDSLHFGFLPFVFSVPVFVLVLAALEHMLDDPSTKRKLTFAIAAALLFLSHALTYQCALITIFFLWSTHRARTLRTGIQVFLALIPSLALHAFWMYRDLPTFDVFNAGLGHAQLEGPLRSAHTSWIPRLNVLHRMSQAPQFFLGGMREASIWYMVGVSTLLCELLFACWWHFRRERILWLRDGTWRLAGVAGLLLALYFLLPVSIANVWGVAPRMLTILVCVLGAVIPAWGSEWRWRWIASVPQILFTLCVGLDQRQKFLDFQREVVGLSATLAALPEGQRVYPLIPEADSSVLRGARRLHLGAYATVWRSSVSGVNFFHNSAVPVRFRYSAPLLHMGQNSAWRPGEFEPHLYGPFYDAVLVHWPENTPAPFATRWGWEPLAHEGAWLLLRNPRAHRGVAVDAFRENPQRLEFWIETPSGRTSCDHTQVRQWDCGLSSQHRVTISELFVERQRLPCIRIPILRGSTTHLRFTPSTAGDVLHGFVGYPDGQAPEPGEPPAELSFWQGSERFRTHSIGTGTAQSFSQPLPRAGTNPITARFQWQGSGTMAVCFNAFLYDSNR